MKKSIFIRFLLITLIIAGCDNIKKQNNNTQYIIQKETGRIILAYKAFYDFLETDRSWQNYNKLVLEAYPEVRVVHDRQIGWGVIDSVKFPDDLKNYKKEDYKRFLTQYNTESLNNLYDSIINKGNSILPPVSNKKADLCLFLPYGSCFVVPEENKNTIYISMKINPGEVKKIMAHEYGHILHFDRRPDEPLTLKREVINEGMAVYLTNQIISNMEVSGSVPFMSEKSFEWCMENEQLIKDSIKLDLNDTTMNLFFRYISDGSIAKPPEGFVQKTAYFTGYRIIEECIKKGMTLEEISAMRSEEIIEKSGYFTK